MKPLLVEWVYESWKSLTEKQELIRKGWAKCGLGEVLDAKKQVEGLKFVAENAQQLEELAQEEEPAVVGLDEEESDVEDEADASEDADAETTLKACAE